MRRLNNILPNKICAIVLSVIAILYVGLKIYKHKTVIKGFLHFFDNLVPTYKQMYTYIITY